MGRPPEITGAHLARRALVYIRQSTDEQVLNNTGSTEHQRAQAQLPRQWGWPESAIEVIDEDLGLSGAATEHRNGYLRMVAAIEQDTVGGIFMADLSRVGRDATAWFILIERCKLHDVLVVADGRVYDMKDSSEMLLARLLATLSEHDNIMRRETMMRGRLAKARTGYTVSMPPAGYVRQSDGSWIKDPDAAVQASMEALFREFLKHRSCGGTAKALKALGVKLPSRSGTNRLKWVEPKGPRIYVLVIHPAYKGVYAFRRRTSDPKRGRDPRGHFRSRKSTPEELIVTTNHHEGYVTPEVWDQIQAILKLNAPSRERRNLGPGAGLLQGLMRCAIHLHRAMSTVHKPPRRDGSRTHRYSCMGTYFEGGKQCGVPGGHLDRVVGDAALARLSVPRIEAVRAALHARRSDGLAEHRRQQLELCRAQQQADELEDRYVGVDRSNLNVKRLLESRLEQARREVLRLENLAASPPTLPADADEVLTDLLDLCQDLRGLFDASTTTHLDRKQLLRLLIKEVYLTELTAEKIGAEIHWADGSAPTTVTIPRFRYASQVIKGMAAEGASAAAIAVHLTVARFITRTGIPWTAKVVESRLRRMRKSSGR